MSDTKEPGYTPKKGFILDRKQRRVTRKSAFLRKLEKSQAEKKAAADQVATQAAASEPVSDPAPPPPAEPEAPSETPAAPPPRLQVVRSPSNVTPLPLTRGSRHGK